MKSSKISSSSTGRLASGFRAVAYLLLAAMAAGVVSCGTGKGGARKQDFFTSGSREADQRASQRMARDEQLSGSGEGTGEKGVKKARTSGDGSTNGPQAAQVEGKLALYDRLGGDKGLVAIIDDFTGRVLADPRVNWNRKGVKRGFLRSNRSVTWNPTPQNVANLKRHLVQFLALATGGPTRYDGKEMKGAHADMQISNPEFDAAVGDLKATLDKLQMPNKEQKELLAIIESTRPQIVTQR